MSLQNADGQTASHWSALLRGMHSPSVYMCCECVLYVPLFHCFPFSPYPLTLPPSLLFSGAAGSYLKLTLMCAVTSAAAGSKNDTRTHTHRHTHTHNWKSQAFPCYMVFSSTSSSIFSLPLHLSPLYLTHSALRALSSVLRWRGRILFMGRTIWGACHVAEVIRWSTGEEMMNTTLERERERHTSLPLLLPCMALLTSYTHVGAQHSFDLFCYGCPRMGQHNRCCFETTETFPVSNIF